jgi:hypothetical protein
MPATITDTFRRKILDNIYNEIKHINVALGDSDFYYIGIGRSEEWPNAQDNPVTPTPSVKDEREFRSSMQSLKRVDNVSFVSPRYNWSSGTVYSAYDDTGYSTESLLYSYYVITEVSEVYVCLKQGKTSLGVAQTSTVIPADTTGLPFENGDGYVWQHLFTLDAQKVNRYLSSGFLPTEKITDELTDSALSEDDVARRNIQNAAVPGQILGIAIDSAGNGYVSVPSISIIGDGDSAQAYCTIDSASGTIVDVFMKPSAGGSITLGQNYTYANVVLSSGNGALRPIIGPPLGLGNDPRTDLRSNGLIFNIKPDGAENGDFFTNQSFRQVGLIKSPLVDSSGAEYNDLSGTASRYLAVTGASITDGEGQHITGDASTAYAKIDWWDVDNSRIYFHQNETTGFTPFQEGESLTFTDGTSSATLAAEGDDLDSDAWSYADIDKQSGELLYIDNRSYVTRDVGQIEDIKVVIQI